MFCFKLFFITAALVEFALSNPLSDETTTAVEDLAADDETRQIQTGNFYKVSFSVGGDWTHDYVDKTSSTFKALRDQLDKELRNIIIEDTKTDLPSGSFRLLNVLPSVQENFLYVTILLYADNENLAMEFKDVIEYQILINNKLKLSEIPAKVHEDLHMMNITKEEIEMFDEQQIDCNCEFCKSIPEPQTSSDNMFEPELTSEHPTIPQKCSPREEIQRGSTSIFIFENQKCVDHVKSQFSPQPTCSMNKNDFEDSPEVTNDIDMSEEDPMTPQGSEHHQQFVRPEGEIDDQTIVVIKKRGNKVFIEI